MITVILIPSSEVSVTDPESRGSLLGGHMFLASGASGSVVPYGFHPPFHGCKRLPPPIKTPGSLFSSFGGFFILATADNFPPRSIRLSFSHGINLLSNLRPIRWKERLILISCSFSRV
jgi:hypothetical protein